jgi:hypothetical protein
VAFFVRVSFVVGLPNPRAYLKRAVVRNPSDCETYLTSSPCFAVSQTYLTQLGING